MANDLGCNHFVRFTLRSPCFQLKSLIKSLRSVYVREKLFIAESVVIVSSTIPVARTRQISQQPVYNVAKK